MPRLGAFDSGDSNYSESRGRTVRCSVVGAVYGLPETGDPDTPIKITASDYDGAIIDQEMLTALVEVSDHGGLGNTFHSIWRSVLADQDSPALDGNRDGVGEIASALYYTYRWGWHTGFIKMPYYSIQELLATPPPNPIGSAQVFSTIANKNQNDLQRYRLLASLLASEGDSEFDSENFGFLTPDEAQKKYRDSYAKRFESYFGLALGEFLEKVPPQYRQQ